MIKANLFQKIPLSEKLSIIDEVWEEYGINAFCDALDIECGIFYIIWLG